MVDIFQPSLANAVADTLHVGQSSSAILDPVLAGDFSTATADNLLVTTDEAGAYGGITTIAQAVTGRYVGALSAIVSMTTTPADANWISTGGTYAVYYSGSGTTTSGSISPQAQGMQSYVVNTGSGKLDQATCFYASSPVIEGVGTGTFGTAYGVFIEPQSGTGITAGYAIYVNSDDPSVFGATVKTSAKTLSALGSAATAGAGARAFVTDASAALSSSTIGTAVTGGGSNKTPVWSDGATWNYG